MSQMILMLMNRFLSGLFLLQKILWYAQNSQFVQNSIFPDGKLISPVFFIDKYLKFKEIVYLIHEVKFEMRPA